MEPDGGTARPKLVRHLLIAALAAMATACSGSGDSAPTPSPGEPDVDLHGQWMLVAADIQRREFHSPERADLTLVISEAGNQAHAGCTVAWLDPDVSGDSVTLTVTDRGSMRSCPPKTKQGDWDKPYLRAVAAVDHGERSGNTLTLTGPDVRLTYVETG